MKKFKGYWSTTCDGCKDKNCPYMIKHSLWKKVAKDNDFLLCLFCVESRLGRKLYKRDFIEAPINLGIFGFHYSIWTKQRPSKEEFSKIRKLAISLGLK